MTKFSEIFNLREGEGNRIKTLEEIKSNISFKGANLWTLACAIIIASVGLNVNSTAVIIGAMLISPLMGPIVGAGFALGIYDFDLLKKSLRNLLIATVVSLVVSSLYFYLSPFKDVQSELLARTSPNIYDILIAFFGGLVGVIAVTRTEKGNPIPGVAIATALMPPLCTAGYGIATGQWSFMLGAFYLYCINCTFIGIATFLIVKYLRYPAKEQVDKSWQKRLRLSITTLTLIMLVPSAWLAYSLYREQQFKKNAEAFINSEFTEKGYTVVYKKTDFKSAPKRIEVALLSKRFTKEELKSLQADKEKNSYLKGVYLHIRQDSTDRFTALRKDIMDQIKTGESQLNEKDLKILQLENRLKEYRLSYDGLFKEASILFPEITSLSVSRQRLETKDSILPINVALYNSNKVLIQADNERLKKWLEQRIGVKDVKLIRVTD
ncbi:DUF389 domain-containing protein [Flavobacterium sp. AG291]|uniref:DUF389 domain-containing protein n=1 Tax=Flavobacterium sp. AG291 TaxID=2184000 RepID=UPI000E0A05ED|nr:DUF389 domain-containing protein [Flavobacterium sp. AG291]RDI09753.1 putative hydrophobic protein (TIGR00271 family) [Flavobacterium sp. AG291]